MNRPAICDPRENDGGWFVVQGVWNNDDGFVLTDPVIHYVSSRDPRRKHRNGATDKGREGVTKFFNTHKCGPLCRRLGLTLPSF